MELDIIDDLPADLWLQISIAYREPKSNSFQDIFAYNVNVCSIFSKELNNLNLIHAWLGNLLKYSNMPKSCPVKKSTYYWHKLKPEKHSIPTFIMSGLYRVFAAFYMKDLNNDLLTNTTMIVDVKMK